MTVSLRLDPEQPSREAIEWAAGIIQQGGLVAFPTETVYGVGADALNAAAVNRIFDAKGRPSDNPLIVHVASRKMLDRLVARVPEKAERLMERFWPGPLTLVLERKADAASAAAAGLPTLAVRMPQNKIALELIRTANTPIAAPSANISGRPSPTRAEHVVSDLSGRIDLILDGGETRIGVESTVLDLTTDPPVVLRPGWITQEELAGVVGAVEAFATIRELMRSPGTRHRHYSPRARVVITETGNVAHIKETCLGSLGAGAVGLICHTPIDIVHHQLRSVVLDNNAESYARSIYDAMRELDSWGAQLIVIEAIAEEGAGTAVMDRIRRAAGEE